MRCLIASVILLIWHNKRLKWIMYDSVPSEKAKVLLYRCLQASSLNVIDDVINVSR